MSLPFALLKVIGKGVLNFVGGGVMGDVLVDVVPEVAQDVCGWWRKERTPEQRRADVEALAQAPAAEVRGAVHDIVLELAADRPAEVRQALSLYLSLVPAAIRQSLRRPADPAGETVPPLLALDEPDDVLPLLPAHMPRFQPGDRPLPGIDWELVELLGVGGFGEVWKAKNPHFDAVPPVALKFCLDSAAKDRLLRHEAAILNQVMRQGRHAGIVALRHTYLSADPPCLEYEFVAGGDLAGLLHDWRARPAGPERAATVTKVVADLARIVGFAHRLSPPIVHRDLKPANVLVEQTADGSLALRVADFGIGGVAAGRALMPTKRNASQGNFLVTALRGAHTPLYASPQQTRGAAPDPRDDVYSLGVIWYQLMTGNLVAGRPGGTRWTKRLTELGLTEPLVELLGACVEEDPADRPADAAELAERITALCGAKAPAAVAPAPPPALERSAAVTNSIGMKLVVIPAGEFQMGSSKAADEHAADNEEPRHRVRITRPFYMAATEATQGQYRAVTGQSPSQFRGSDDLPVEQVSWLDAVKFCNELSAREQLTWYYRIDGKSVTIAGGNGYRLPTEAEWEYACRAGTTTIYSCGDDESRLNDFAWIGVNSGGRSHPVGEKPANAFGLYDMHGNVFEWVWDGFDPGYYRRSPTDDPTGSQSSVNRIHRGGGFSHPPDNARSAVRVPAIPSFANLALGFRVARDR